MPIPEPEPAILAAAASGDREAFSRLMALYQDPVWRFLARLLGDPGYAEDLTQETFLRVYRGLPGFAGRSRLSTWIFGIARHTALDALRKQERRPRVVSSLTDLVGSDLTRTAAPSVLADLAESLDLHAAIGALPIQQRETLLLVEVLGLSYREVAEVSGVAEGTVKSRMYHARRNLHAALSSSEPIDRRSRRRSSGTS